MSRRRDRRRGFRRLPHGKGWARTLPAGAVHARWVGRSMPCPAAAGAALARTGPTPLAPRRRQVECPMNHIECAPGIAFRRPTAAESPKTPWSPEIDSPGRPPAFQGYLHGSGCPFEPPECRARLRRQAWASVPLCRSSRTKRSELAGRKRVDESGQPARGVLSESMRKFSASNRTVPQGRDAVRSN